ncbi:predicted protein [Naegleria gruberi]|uniref:Predicted protein n=1 Tax=Naegleria gruberi TaxID=5762 RepID=D2V6K0_NAEGR|nr:uncharacterized protein NAEGRDRAFT_64466 [Naegleria gruberi]EFC47591.1 predicted protein [Naegleria gruberi]|eukprot:XP_002680335.1 predicted protein [Naegleria gruberi strain NEG-M]
MYEFWKKENEDEKNTQPSSSSAAASKWMGNVGANLGGYINQVKESVVSAGETISNINILQYFNNLIAYLKEINIEKLEKEAEEKALVVYQKQTDKCETEQEKTNQETQNKFLKSFQDLFQSQDHPIHQMKIEKSGLSKILNMVPFISYVETMFKYVIYQSMNIIFEAIRYSNLLSQEQKDQLVEDVSKIVIKNSLDPMSLAVELVEFTSLRLGADPKVASQLSHVTKLLPYLKNVAGFVKKFK